MKMLIFPSFDGYLTIHHGVFCGPFIFAPKEVLRIAHFKQNARYERNIESSSYLKIYSHALINNIENH
jgi:hypothetical protein